MPSQGMNIVIQFLFSDFLLKIMNIQKYFLKHFQKYQNECVKKLYHLIFSQTKMYMYLK